MHVMERIPNDLGPIGGLTASDKREKGSSVRGTPPRNFTTEIREVLAHRGELGVNAIAKLIEQPVATVQRFLERQEYFIKTENRKWKLPADEREWPLDEIRGETEVPDEIRKWVSDPDNHLREILETMRYADYYSKLYRRQWEFLYNLTRTRLEQTRA